MITISIFETIAIKTIGEEISSIQNHSNRTLPRKRLDPDPNHQSITKTITSATNQEFPKTGESASSGEFDHFQTYPVT